MRYAWGTANSTQAHQTIRYLWCEGHWSGYLLGEGEYRDLNNSRKYQFLLILLLPITLKLLQLWGHVELHHQRTSFKKISQLKRESSSRHRSFIFKRAFSKFTRFFITWIVILEPAGYSWRYSLRTFSYSLRSHENHSTWKAAVNSPGCHNRMLAGTTAYSKISYYICKYPS